MAWPAPADICREAGSSRWPLMPETLYVHAFKQRRGVEALCQFFFREFLQAGMLLRAPETTAGAALKRSQGCREPGVIESHEQSSRAFGDASC